MGKGSNFIRHPRASPVIPAKAGIHRVASKGHIILAHFEHTPGHPEPAEGLLVSPFP